MNIRIVCCTKLNKENFLNSSMLGKSLLKHFACGNITTDGKELNYIFFNNTEGLSKRYNEVIQRSNDNDDVLLFIHDDVYINDIEIPEKLKESFKSFDVIGLAGTSHWKFSRPCVWHTSNRDDMSGAVYHRTPEKEWLTFFGKTPKKCVFLDGLFLAVNRKKLIQHNVKFDEQFQFHHYDMDFCLTAKTKGLSLGTCSITVTHESIGDYRNDKSFFISQEAFAHKWTNCK